MSATTSTTSTSHCGKPFLKIPATNSFWCENVPHLKKKIFIRALALTFLSEQLLNQPAVFDTHQISRRRIREHRAAQFRITLARLAQRRSWIVAEADATRSRH